MIFSIIIPTNIFNNNILPIKNNTMKKIAHVLLYPISGSSSISLESMT